MKKIINKFFNLTVMGHWWVMLGIIPLGIPDLVWSGFRENIFGSIYLVLLGLFILINLVLLVFKFLKEVWDEDEKEIKKKQKRMGSGVVIFLGIFGILMFLFWLFLSYMFIEYFLGNHTFEDKEYDTFTIPAKYIPFIMGAMWFGALSFVVQSFNDIKKWLKNK